MYNIAKRLAAKSSHRQHHHACIITKGSKVIATGYNHKYMHAEADALRKIVTRYRRTGKPQKGLRLYSMRWRKNGTWGDSKPCDRCQTRMAMLEYEGVVFLDAVYYTNEEGKLVKL